MSVDQSLPMARLHELRGAFDRTFAEPPPAAAAPQDDFLAVGVGGDPYLFRLSDIRGLHLARTTTALPGSVPALLGLVGLRGALLPVYDLAVLLGYPKAAPPRWLAVIGDGQMAVGFEQFAGHVRVARASVADAAPGQGTGRRPLVREYHHNGAVVRPIVHVPSVLEAIAVMAGQLRGRTKE